MKTLSNNALQRTGSLRTVCQGANLPLRLFESLPGR